MRKSVKVRGSAVWGIGCNASLHIHKRPARFDIQLKEHDEILCIQTADGCVTVFMENGDIDVLHDLLCSIIQERGP
jgi:hypothetical protein